MAVQWTLKQWLAREREIYRPSELRALLLEKTDLRLSLQAVSTLVNQRPSALRLRTIQALCQALNCSLSDFCQISPDAEPAAATSSVLQQKSTARRKKRPSIRRCVPMITFPDPQQFRPPEGLDKPGGEL